MRPDKAALPSWPTLSHFTRASGRTSAMDNLIRILEQGVIRGSTRMVRGGASAVCLFDSPLRDLAMLLGDRNRRRYEPFGITVDKRYAFSAGARPVIYLPLAEAAALLKPEEMWRVVSIEMARTPPVDWTFEHEWRVKGDLPLIARSSVALVSSWRDAEEIYDRFGGHPPCAGVLPLRELFHER